MYNAIKRHHEAWKDEQLDTITYILRDVTMKLGMLASSKDTIKASSL